MRILALDLASATGFATNTGEGVDIGTWRLSTASEVRSWGIQRLTRRNDPRAKRLFDLVSQFKVDVVVFEDVEFQTYTQQCQLWSSLRAVVWLAFPAPVIIECVPVATLKRFATGHGGATKSMMMSAAVRDGNNQFKVCETKRGEIVTLKDTVTGNEIDDNAIDAYHLFKWAQRNLGRMK